MKISSLALKLKNRLPMNLRPGIILLFFLIAFSTSAQRIDNELIIEGNKKFIQNLLTSNNRASIDIAYSIKTISKSQNLHLLTFPTSTITQKHFQILEQRGFRCYYNHQVQNRFTPNDERIDNQWALRDISIFEAWDETIGEKDFGGNQPVIAILDDGFDIDHEDVADNVFINTFEIPNNNIDDDQNGYIDDYKGYHTGTANDQHPKLTHGTSVMGITSAIGNNGIGISGILWNTKVLLISGIESEADVLEAYDYIYTMRKLYDDTNGTRGAYIVTTNFSGGLDNAWAEDHMDWCNQYERLGELGILSISAATNNDVTIDEVGDIPATCNSQYLIIVHDINEIGQRSSSGKSRKYVDIAAPGKKILSLDTEDGYKEFNGTSAAAPFVAGAAALLYSSPCEAFYKRLQESPSNGAKIIKEALLSGSNKLNSLVNQNISEGSLNVFGAMVRIASLCEQDLGELEILRLYNRHDELVVKYQTDGFEDHVFMLHNSVGQEVYKNTFRARLFGERELLIPSYGFTPSIYFATLMSEGKIVTRGFYMP